MMAKTKQQINRRRYYLHYRLRKAGYTVKSSKKTVEVEAIEFADKSTPEPYAGYLKELARLNYAIQSTIK